MMATGNWEWKNGTMGGTGDKRKVKEGPKSGGNSFAFL